MISSKPSWQVGFQYYETEYIKFCKISKKNHSTNIHINFKVGQESPANLKILKQKHNQHLLTEYHTNKNLVQYEHYERK
jgi:hypothetical protein